MLTKAIKDYVGNVLRLEGLKSEVKHLIKRYTVWATCPGSVPTQYFINGIFVL